MKNESRAILVLKNANLIDGVSHKIKSDITIMVQDGIIAYIGKENDALTPAHTAVLSIISRSPRIYEPC